MFSCCIPYGLNMFSEAITRLDDYFKVERAAARKHSSASPVTVKHAGQNI